MIYIGEYNELRILRETSVGLYLGDEDDEEVLLPNKYLPSSYELDDVLDVFVYLDHEERKIATDIEPLIFLNQFALLQVTDVSSVGAFLDWGMEKELFVPFREQRQKMQPGRWYVVRMMIDEQTDRLYASNRVERYLDNEELTVEEGQEVDLVVLSKTDMGYSVIVNHLHKGLVFENEVFKPLNVGEALSGYVKKINEENKIDISVQPIGYLNFNDKNCSLVHDALLARGGRLPVSDKSSPEEISELLGISKKAFKKAVGSLYKSKVISIEKNEIILVKN